MALEHDRLLEMIGAYPDGLDEVAILDLVADEETWTGNPVDHLFELVMAHKLTWHGPHDLTTPLIYKIAEGV